MTEAREFELLCEECGKVVAVFELLLSGVPRRRDRDHPLRDVQRRWVYVWTFQRYGDSEVDPSEYRRLLAALESRDWRALDKIDWHHAVPWCRECDRWYCADHWTVEDVDHPLCSEWGTCPKGHGKILDD